MRESLIQRISTKINAKKINERIEYFNSSEDIYDEEENQKEEFKEKNEYTKSEIIDNTIVVNNNEKLNEKENKEKLEEYKKLYRKLFEKDVACGEKSMNLLEKLVYNYVIADDIDKIYACWALIKAYQSTPSYKIEEALNLYEKEISLIMDYNIRVIKEKDIDKIIEGNNNIITIVLNLINFNIKDIKNIENIQEMIMVASNLQENQDLFIKQHIEKSEERKKLLLDNKLNHLELKKTIIRKCLLLKDYDEAKKNYLELVKSFNVNYTEAELEKAKEFNCLERGTIILLNNKKNGVYIDSKLDINTLIS